MIKKIFLFTAHLLLIFLFLKFAIFTYKWFIRQGTFKKAFILTLIPIAFLLLGFENSDDWMMLIGCVFWFCGFQIVWEYFQLGDLFKQE